MNSYPAGSTVTLEVSIGDIAPTGASYRVLDELDAVVVAPTELTIPNGASILSITVPASVNVLPPTTGMFENGTAIGVPRSSTGGLRAVEVTFRTAAGPVIATQRYLVLPSNGLFVMQNSFQTFNQALLVAASMPNLNGWVIATTTDAARTAALSEAYLRLTRLGYYVRWPRDPDAQNTIAWGTVENAVIVPRLWSVMTLERWTSLYPETFRDAMRRAQIAEADQILKGDPILAKRQAGILSETTGQSSMMFRSRKPVDFGISAEALAYLVGFVDLRFTVARGR